MSDSINTKTGDLDMSKSKLYSVVYTHLTKEGTYKNIFHESFFYSLRTAELAANYNRDYYSDKNAMSIENKKGLFIGEMAPVKFEIHEIGRKGFVALKTKTLGDDPFIYGGNLSEEELCDWLKIKLFALEYKVKTINTLKKEIECHLKQNEGKLKAINQIREEGIVYKGEAPTHHQTMAQEQYETTAYCKPHQELEGEDYAQTQKDQQPPFHHSDTTETEQGTKTQSSPLTTDIS